jgi:hypothetical protein
MATITAPLPRVSPQPQALAPEKKGTVAPVPAAAAPAQESAGSHGDMIALMFLVLCMAGLALSNLLDLALALLR